MSDDLVTRLLAAIEETKQSAQAATDGILHALAVGYGLEEETT